jgi:phosphatidylserine/phosphatidylglycerophosphate/cardiolipin synthase-like enzyme
MKFRAVKSCRRTRTEGSYLFAGGSGLTTEEWVPVYIHSKLMIVNDVFTTHGSANINTRSMQVDSEMNIAHEWASVTQDLRRRLFGEYSRTRGQDAKDAFKAWEDLINANAKLQGTGKGRPEASLIKFYYSKPTLSDLD